VTNFLVNVEKLELQRGSWKCQGIKESSRQNQERCKSCNASE